MTTRRLLPLIAVLLLAVAGCGQSPEPTGGAVHAGTTTHPAKRDRASHRSARHASRARIRPARHNVRASAQANLKGSGSAAAALAALPVKGRAPKTGYSREQFGGGWSSVDGCDTRDRILARDLTAKAYLDGCRIEAGTLNDPYTAARIGYRRGGASEVDIDHVVALGDAWQKGAQQWPYARRMQFANDPLNLLAVDASANRQKSDADAATWLPANKPFRCDYVARQVAVKAKYRAWVTPAEHDAIARVLTSCPGQTLPGSGRYRLPVVPSRTEPAPVATAKPASPRSRSARGRVYASCDAARAAGVAPILRGSPDYAANPDLDRDHDGVACESGASERSSQSSSGSNSRQGHVYASCDAARAAGAAPIMRGSADYDANRSLDRDGDGVACES